MFFVTYMTYCNNNSYLNIKKKEYFYKKARTLYKNIRFIMININLSKLEK